jgi:hypothetical protein
VQRSTTCFTNKAGMKCNTEDRYENTQGCRPEAGLRACLIIKHSLLLLWLIASLQTCQADQVWKCGSIYTSQEGPGCTEITAGVAKGTTGNRVFSSPQTKQSRSASVITPVAPTLSAPESEDPRISGTLFTTHDDKPLVSSNAPEKPKTEDTAAPTAKCLIEAMLGDKEAAARCGMRSLDFSEFSKILQ